MCRDAAQSRHGGRGLGLESPALGDVGLGAEHPARPAVGMPLDDAPALLEPAPAAVGRAGPVVACLVCVGLAAGMALVGVVVGGPVIGMDQGIPILLGVRATAAGSRECCSKPWSMSPSTSLSMSHSQTRCRPRPARRGSAAWRPPLVSPAAVTPHRNRVDALAINGSRAEVGPGRPDPGPGQSSACPAAGPGAAARTGGRRRSRGGVPGLRWGGYRTGNGRAWPGRRSAPAPEQPVGAGHELGTRRRCPRGRARRAAPGGQAAGRPVRRARRRRYRGGATRRRGLARGPFRPWSDRVGVVRLGHGKSRRGGSAQRPPAITGPWGAVQLTPWWRTPPGVQCPACTFSPAFSRYNVPQYWGSGPRRCPPRRRTPWGGWPSAIFGLGQPPRRGPAGPGGHFDH